MSGVPMPSPGSMAENRRKLFDRLEPGVDAGGLDTSAALSIAISLKRLADMAEKLEGDGLPNNLRHSINAVAYEAGLNFRNGNGR